eukprot:XP_011619563.1 PREDICTED: galactose-3-O-sulfotransferase 3-like [Takifugu rubripes]
MLRKKIFLFIVAISTLSLLLHQGIHSSWIMEPFYFSCPSLQSHPAPGLKPKHTNVAFLKTHKTASSTMQNLLFRFAEGKKLEGGSMYAHNTLAFDLGLDKDRSGEDEEYVQASLAEVEKVFSLVMIAEYFDESLVLLRHLLSWDLDDILYFKLNMRKASSKHSLTPGLATKIRSWNSLDARLYDHFNASLWRQISALGLACVAREVQFLRQAQEKLMRSCFDGTVPLLRSASQIKNNNLRPWQPRGKVDIMGYDLPANLSRRYSSQAQELCFKLIMPEVQYTQVLLQSQSIRYQLRSPQQSHPLPLPIRRTTPRHPQVQQSQLPPSAPGSVSVTGFTNSKQTAAPQDPNVGTETSQTQNAATEK